MIGKVLSTNSVRVFFSAIFLFLSPPIVLAQDFARKAAILEKRIMNHGFQGWGGDFCCVYSAPPIPVLVGSN